MSSSPIRDFGTLIPRELSQKPLCEYPSWAYFRRRADGHMLLSDDVIPYAIKQIKAKGYKMVTVAECLGKSPYQSTKSPSERDVSNLKT